MNDSFEQKKLELIRKLNEAGDIDLQNSFLVPKEKVKSTWDIGKFEDNIPDISGGIIIRRKTKIYAWISILLLVYEINLIRNYFNSPDFLFYLLLPANTFFLINAIFLSFRKTPI